MKNRINRIIVAAVVAAGVSWSALPAMADPTVSWVEATADTITIHNPSTSIVTYRVQVYDAEIRFDLDSGAKRTFESVPALDPVHWAVWSGDLLIDSGTMDPAPYGDTLPDEAVAAELAPAPVVIVDDDTGWVRTGECHEDEPCWDCETMGNGICGPDTERPAELIPPLVVVNPDPKPATTTAQTNTVPAWEPHTIVAGQAQAV